MLQAHLHPDWEAASRRHEDIDRSVEWLSRLIPPGSSILDLGCGPGLYTERLATLGYDVTGLDISRRSIAYAQEHDRQSQYLYKNYLELDYTEAFDMITLIYCDYGALTQSERHALLGKVHRALKPGGLFIMDVFTHQTIRSKQDSTSWSAQPDGGFWHTEPHICLEAAYYYEDHTVEARQTVAVTANELHQYLIWNTVYTRETLAAEVLPWGFQVDSVYDDSCGSPYTGEADTLCFVLRK
ncbi:class I SAM-dependent methyltransferase [Paenibacillus piscarius]|uniref:class I SAM-dependent methyltransferase n=1 Tax=Paenibacillus piscarius TaxID=1089681 RepID=UPI001EE95C40|nr:class I SAM-dependent methyltransferase [Paenibacillus piscarius]